MKEILQTDTNNFNTNDEIDLFELFNTLWNYRIKIVVITAVFLLLGIFYTLIATPQYKASALVEIGYYKTQDAEILLAKASEVIEKLRINYIDLRKDTKDKNETIESIDEIKNNTKFFNITSIGKSNKLASSIIEEMVSNTAIEHQKILDGYITSQNTKINSITRQINYLKENKVIELKNQITNIQNETIPRLEKQIKHINEVTIPLVELDIKNIGDITIPTTQTKIDKITSEIENYKSDLKTLEKDISKASGNLYMFLISKQQNLTTLISSSENRLIELENQLETLSSKTKLELQARVDKLKTLDLTILQENLNTIYNQTLPTLQRELDAVMTSEIEDLLDQKALLELSLKPYNYKNTAIVCDIVTYQNPIKPKKAFIWAVSLIAGFMFAVFGVLVYDAIKKRVKA
ncbi:MAG: chain length determinant protein [Campylobacter sp.]|nr:chain length determinant protein [Campylobacter sp.]